MIDYLEEHLGGAEALLERIRKLDQREAGLSRMTTWEENAGYMGHSVENTQDNGTKSGIVSQEYNKVYNINMNVDLLDYLIDDTGSDLKKHEKAQDIDVNHQKKEGYNAQDLEQIALSPGAEGARTGPGRGPSPLSAQLEELDRAVSALTAPVPESRETARGGYPISPPGPQNLTAVPGEIWSGPDAAAGADLACGGRQTWAEQADRIFRRDSRRYDGGFTLY